MMPDRRQFLASFTSRTVWMRAVTIGTPVAVIQVLINQGDHWARGPVTTALVLKTILSPLVTYAVALLSAASTYNLRRN